MKRMITLCLLVIMGSLASGSVPQAHGALHYLPIPFEYNGHNWDRDVNYPTGSQLVLGGIPFDIPSNPNQNTWDSIVGEATGPKTLTIPVNRAHVREVHALFNCSWGGGWPTIDHPGFLLVGANGGPKSSHRGGRHPGLVERRLRQYHLSPYRPGV
jgi:hypothetical protein